jgi:hypothetical protein
MAEPDVARFEALLTSRGRELLDRIATEAPGPDTALRIGASLRGLYPTELVIEALALASAPISWAMLRSCVLLVSACHGRGKLLLLGIDAARRVERQPQQRGRIAPHRQASARPSHLPPTRST